MAPGIVGISSPLKEPTTMTDFDEPDGDQAADPHAATWELWQDLRHRDEFTGLTMKQWDTFCAPKVTALIMSGWTVQGLYGRLTVQLPAAGVGNAASFIAARLGVLGGQE